jgi:membrane fusion protein
MRKGLFRQQAIEQQCSPIAGTLLVTPRTSFMVTTIVLIAWLIAVLLYLNTSSYARKASVSGWLESSQGVQKVYAAKRRGRIEQIMVEEGQVVEAGAPLLTLDYAMQQAGNTSVEATLLEQLRAKKQRLIDVHRATLNVQAQEVSNLTHKIAERRSNLDVLEKIASMAAAAHTLNQKQLSSIVTLADTGHATTAERDDQILTTLSSEQALTRAHQEIALAKDELAVLIQKRLDLPTHYAISLAENENAISDLTTQIITLENDAYQTLYAAETGVIANLQVKAGQHIDPNIPLLSLLPRENTIEAKILVPVHAAGFIEEGQGLDIRYDAFPYQKFGLQKGNIVTISPALILPGEWANSPVSIDEPVYVITASLHRDSINAYGTHIALKVGMTFSADVSLSQRTLIEWLLEPLYSISGRI